MKPITFLVDLTLTCLNLVKYWSFEKGKVCHAHSNFSSGDQGLREKNLKNEVFVNVFKLTESFSTQILNIKY